jgi:hypothetical protein
MNSRFHVPFRWLPLLAVVVFAACERSREAGARDGGRLTLDDSYRAEAHECATPAEAEALELVNEARAASGAGAYQCLGSLSAMAAAHAAFLASNENLRLDSAHREQAGAPGYTGDTLTERAHYQNLDPSNFWLS